MLLSAARAGNARIDHLTYQRMIEGVRSFTRRSHMRRPAPAQVDEILCAERAQRRAHLICAQVLRQIEQRAGPEIAPHDGGMLQGVALGRRKQIEARSQHTLHGIWYERIVYLFTLLPVRRDTPATGAILDERAAINEHAHDLFDIERIAISFPKDPPPQRLRRG